MGVKREDNQWRICYNHALCQIFDEPNSSEVAMGWPRLTYGRYSDTYKGILREARRTKTGRKTPKALARLC